MQMFIVMSMCVLSSNYVHIWRVNKVILESHYNHDFCKSTIQMTTLKVRDDLFGT